MMEVRRSLAVLSMLLIPTCDVAETPPPISNNVCESATVEATLPAAIRETSGIASSRTHAGVYWTHNDSGGDPAVFAIDSTGRILARVRVTGAVNRDWEDIATGPCEPGSAGSCIFIAETGDNNERHRNVAIYRIAEPDPAADTASDPADTFRFTYPGGPRDAEGLYVTDAGLHVVTKGRSGAIELYRLPPPYDATATIEIQSVQRLAPPPSSHSAQVTAAAASPDGRRIAIRSYSGIRFYQPDADTLRPAGRNADIVAPSQMQGEAIDFVGDGRYILTTEAAGSRPPALAIVACDPARPAPDTSASDP
jgi:hypothetical protein